MQKLLPFLLIVIACVPFARSASEAPKEKPAASAKHVRLKWYTSIKSARKAAAEEKKPLVVLFTGSDWCPYCIKLEKEILSKPEFAAWAPEHVILFIADAKGGPDKLSPDNRKLMKEYGAHGFPSVFVTDAAGTKLGETGYIGGTPADYCKVLEGMFPAKK